MCGSLSRRRRGAGLRCCHPGRLASRAARRGRGQCARAGRIEPRRSCPDGRSPRACCRAMTALGGPWHPWPDRHGEEAWPDPGRTSGHRPGTVTRRPLARRQARGGGAGWPRRVSVPALLAFSDFKGFSTARDKSHAGSPGGSGSHGEIFRWRSRGGTRRDDFCRSSRRGRPRRERGRSGNRRLRG